MAFKGTKRAASKAAGADRKRAGGSVAKKCRTLVATIRGAEDVPKPVRSMLCDTLVRTFSTYKEDRHPLQATFSKLVGDILNGAQSKLQGAIADAEQKQESTKTEAATVISAYNGAVAKSEAAAKVLADSKAGVAALKVALKDAKSSLHDLEVEGKTADSDAAATTSKKDKLEALAREHIVAIKEGTQHGAGAGRHVGKELASNADSFGKEFLECVTKTFSKPASAWGTFDHLIDKKLEESLKGVLTGLTSSLEAMASAKETRSAQVEALKGAVVVAEEKVKAMEEACANAAVSAKDSENAAKAATTAAKQEQQHIQKAADSCNHAEAALTAFVSGPLAAFTEVEARAAPPPPAPELVETAPLVDAVMEPAPPAAEWKAPAVLPSPGVLSRAAQAVGLAPSPRVVSSPRAA